MDFQYVNLPILIIDGGFRTILMRTFVAVEVSNSDALDTIAGLQSDLQGRASPVGRHNMHFTLLFLGEITEEVASAVKNALADIAFSPISVTFTHVGAFPSPKAPRVVWLGVDDASAAKLVELAKQVEHKLQPLGFRPDKPFKPHLTIFRVKNREDYSARISKLEKGNFGSDVIRELKFKQSVLTSNGPIYSDLLVVKAR